MLAGRKNKMGLNEIKEKISGAFGHKKKMNIYEVEQQQEFLESEKIRLNKLKEMKKVEVEVAQLQAELAEEDNKIAKSNQKRMAMAPKQSSGGLTLFSKQ